MNAIYAAGSRGVGHGLLGAAFLALVAGIAVAPATRADDVDLISGKGYASLGVFTNSSELKIRVDGEAGEQGTEVDWNNKFGDDEKTRFRLDGLYRFTPKHHLRMMYTDYSRSNTRTLEEDIDWQGDTILAGSSIKGETAFSILEAAYEYGFHPSEDLELGLSAGLHWAAFEASIKADVQTPGGGTAGQIGGKASVDLPLPVFGGRALWRMGGDFYLDAMVQWFALSIDEYDGSIINYRAALLWQPSKWVGLGIGYDSFNVDVDVDKDKFLGSIDWTYSGPQVFYNVSF